MLKFVAYSEALRGRRKISVDGLVPDALCLTHWPGNGTPPALKADTSTEIVIRLLASGRFDEVTRGYEVVTNNHFDTDGVIPSWLLLNPDADRGLFAGLVAAARAGDFLWVEDERAAKFNFLVESYADATISPLRAKFDGLARHERDQLCYDALHAEMPGIFVEVERHRDLWERDWDRWRRNRDEAAATARLTEHPDRFFAFVEGTKYYNLRALLNLTRMDRVLLAWPYGDGWRYQFVYSKYSWYDVTRPCGKRVEFGPLVEALASMERAPRGRWVNEMEVGAEDGFLYRFPTRLFFGEAPNVFFTSSIPPDRAVGAFLDFFAAESR
jgi:hypothetical protein